MFDVVLSVFHSVASRIALFSRSPYLDLHNVGIHILNRKESQCMVSLDLCRCQRGILAEF